MRNYSIPRLVLLLMPFVFSFAFAVDMYIPAIPAMTQFFNASPALIQLVLSLFFLTLGFGQLLIGPYADQFGRKPTLYIAGVLFALGSVGCAMATSIYFLLVARVVCALGACGMFVVGFAIVRDLFSGDESARVYSLLNASIGVSPLFAPLLGGYLAVWFGWQSVFVFLALVGVAGIVLNRCSIQETHAVANRLKVDGAILKRYGQILSHRQFITYTLIAALAGSVFFCFLSVSPFIIISLLKVPTEHFGYYFALFGTITVSSGFASGKLIKWLGSYKVTLLSIVFLFIGGAGMLIWYYCLGLSLAGLLVPLVFAASGAMFLLGIAAAKAMEPFPHVAGTAAAALGCIQFTLPSIIGAILLYFPVTSTVSYGICILVIASLILSLFLLAPHPRTPGSRITTTSFPG